MIQAQTSDEENYVGYDCEFCIAKEMMGRRTGRLCLLYQIDIESETLEYYSVTRSGEVIGVTNSEISFNHAVNSLLNLHQSDRVEVALKFFKLKNSRTTGICPKSFPKSQLTVSLLSKLNLCLGGHSGVELVHLPYEGGLFDQPNVFIEAYQVYSEEFNKFWRVQRKERANRVKTDRS